MSKSLKEQFHDLCAQKGIDPESGELLAKKHKTTVSSADDFPETGVGDPGDEEDPRAAHLHENEVHQHAQRKKGKNESSKKH